MTNEPSLSAQLRAIERFLELQHFPADRDELLERGIEHQATPAVLQLLCALPPHQSWPGSPAVLGELGLPARAPSPV